MAASNIDKVGFFDSKMVFPNIKVTPKRKVKLYEIELFTETAGTTVIDGREHQIRKGTLLVAKPGQIRHSILHFKAYYVHLDQSDPLLTSYLDKLPDLIRILDFHRCASIFTAMIRAQSSQDPAKRLAVKGKLYELVHLIYTFSQNKLSQKVHDSESNFQLMMELATFIDRNLDKEITLSFLSQKASLSPIYLHKLFKRYLGKTPHKYLSEKRMEAAKALLLSTNLTVTEIAYRTGFSSQAYFN
ncbi:MAG TPA: AraC family transcriptional regulator, partial [Bacillota bacterium]|nr:AraC family transcriptional regulator [Bacillota bacterium]